MTKLKKTAVIFLCAMIAVFITFSLIGCSENEEDKKYDVAIRVACSDGMTYEFPVGEDEKHITIPYDGIERTFWVDSYNLPDHPRYGDDWFSPKGEGANVFQMAYLYIAPNGEDFSYDRIVCNRGDYVVTTMADSTSDLWNFRACQLFIKVE